MNSEKFEKMGVLELVATVCTDYCQAKEECFSKNEDPDIANDELEEKFCCECPIWELSNKIHKVVSTF